MNAKMNATDKVNVIEQGCIRAKRNVNKLQCHWAVPLGRRIEQHKSWRPWG